MIIPIITHDELHKWSFELNLKGKFTTEQTLREVQRYIFLKTVYLLLVLKEYDRNDIWSDDTQEHLDLERRLIHPETIMFLMSYAPKISDISAEIDEIYQRLSTIFRETLEKKHDIFESWAIKAKKMLTVLNIPDATESEAFYAENDIDDVLREFFQ